MKTLMFVAEKGGVGKTALAEEIRHHFERVGVPVSYYNLDPQYRDRTRKVKGARVAVVDTPGRLEESLRKTLAAADVVVVPTRCGLNEVEPLKRTLDVVCEGMDGKVAVVVNAVTPYGLSVDFMEWLRRYWDGPIYIVHQSEAFGRAIGSGQSVVGHDRYGKVSADKVELCNGVSGYLGLPKE